MHLGVATGREVQMQVMATPHHGLLKAMVLTFGATVLVAGGSQRRWRRSCPN